MLLSKFLGVFHFISVILELGHYPGIIAKDANTNATTGKVANLLQVESAVDAGDLGCELVVQTVLIDCFFNFLQKHHGLLFLGFTPGQGSEVFFL